MMKRRDWLRTASGMALAAALPSGVGIAADSSVLIKNVTLIDGTGRAPRAGTWVLVEGDRIAAIRDRAIKAPKGAAVIDGRGKFLIPGLMDTHVHLDGGRRGAMGTERTLVIDKDIGRRMLHGYLYSGVTAVYDCGNHDKFVFAMRDDERSGRLQSPRIFATGHLITRVGGYAASGGGATIDTAEQGMKDLDVLLPQKPDLVKFTLATRSIGSNAQLPPMDVDVLHRLFLYANERGFRTTIHAVEQDLQRAAIHAGVDALAHPVYLTETDDNLAHLIAAKGIPVSTTLIVLKNISMVANDPSFFEEPLYKMVMAPEDLAFYRDSERKRYLALGMARWGDESFRFAAANVRKIYDAGGILALGTDRTIGPSVHQELELIVGLGIAPIEALKIGTLNAAKYLRIEDKLGSIEEGKIADMVMLDADPLADIRNTKTINTVVLGGKLVDRSKLDLPGNA